MKSELKKALKGYKRGKCQGLDKCCRDVRIGAICASLYAIIHGFNTITEQVETWIIIKMPKPNHKQSERVLMQIFNKQSK